MTNPVYLISFRPLEVTSREDYDVLLLDHPNILLSYTSNLFAQMQLYMGLRANEIPGEAPHRQCVVVFSICGFPLLIARVLWVNIQTYEVREYLSVGEYSGSEARMASSLQGVFLQNLSNWINMVSTNVLTPVDPNERLGRIATWVRQLEWGTGAYFDTGDSFDLAVQNVLQATPDETISQTGETRQALTQLVVQTFALLKTQLDDELAGELASDTTDDPNCKDLTLFWEALGGDDDD